MTERASGQLYYLMGASGSGKDSLLNGVVACLPDIEVRVVQRYITRPPDSGGEAHAAVDEAEFRSMLERGEFCMHWQAHGVSYGIHREVIEWLNQGAVVLLNGSRDYLARARSTVVDLIPVLIEVSASVQKQRLTGRAREGEAEIQARLARQVSVNLTDSTLVVINNDNDLQLSVSALGQLIRSRMGAS